MSAAPGGELQATLQRLADEVNTIKQMHTQQGVEVNSLRLNITEVGRTAVDQITQSTATKITELQYEVGSFLTTQQARVDEALQQIARTSRALQAQSS